MNWNFGVTGRDFEILSKNQTPWSDDITDNSD